MDEILLETEEKMTNTISNLEKRLLNIRAGRANPAILDGISVSYYGVDTPLKGLQFLYQKLDNLLLNLMTVLLLELLKKLFMRQI